MHATVWCDTTIDGASDQDARVGRALATHLSKLPGFVAYVALEVETGGIAAVCIFEDTNSMAVANDLIAAYQGMEGAWQGAGPAPLHTGEVIVQKGL
jgi:hypothetical protein